jgi:hypothetical protein
LANEGNGHPTSADFAAPSLATVESECIRFATKLVKRLYGHWTAIPFSPVALKAARQS